MTLILTLPKTLPGSTWVPMPSLVLIGPAVRPAIGNRQTDRQINKQTYRLLYVRLWNRTEKVQQFFLSLKKITACLFKPLTTQPICLVYHSLQLVGDCHCNRGENLRDNSAWMPRRHEWLYGERTTDRSKSTMTIRGSQADGHALIKDVFDRDNHANSTQTRWMIYIKVPPPHSHSVRKCLVYLYNISDLSIF